MCCRKWIMPPPSLLQVDFWVGAMWQLGPHRPGCVAVSVVWYRSHKATCKTRGKINDLGHIGTVVKGQRRWVLRRLLCVSNLKH